MELEIMITQENSIVKIDKILPNAWNPKKFYLEDEDGKKNYERIKKSITKHGQIDPILVREIDNGYEIVNGFHRYTAAKELGYKELEIKNLGKISDEKAKAIALATEDARVPLDRIMVAEIVKGLIDINPEFTELLPYTEEESQELKQLLEFDWS
jgi:ParB family chromosome partitioning protein